MERVLRKRLKGARFIGVPRKRSDAMRAVKGKDNKTTEVRLRLAFVRARLKGWKVRPRGIVGNPDFVFPESRLVVLTDGCFWHGCPKCYHSPIRTRSQYWLAKRKINRARDLSITRQLHRSGWRVLRFWEHQLQSSPDKVIRKIERVIRIP